MSSLNFQYVFLILASLSFYACSEKEQPLKWPNNHLIEISSLDSYSKGEDVILLDIRKPKGFAKGHIPSALNIWRPDIRDEENSIEGLMATKEKMEELLSSLGATPESNIIVYDAKGNPDAARFWWIMNFYGNKNVYLLDGGFTAWKSFNKTASTEKTVPNSTNYKFKMIKSKSLFASKEIVSLAISDTNYIIIDTRSIAEYSGEKQKGNAARAGRIPNSTLINYDENVDYENAMKFKSLETLKEIFKDINPNKNVITYCQSGVRSALTTFVLTELLDYKNVKNYDGSWLEWSGDTTLPIVIDSIIQ